MTKLRDCKEGLLLNKQVLCLYTADITLIRVSLLADQFVEVHKDSYKTFLSQMVVLQKHLC